MMRFVRVAAHSSLHFLSALLISNALINLLLFVFFFSLRFSFDANP